MNIIETKHKWNGTLAKRKQTGYIILHHRAGNGSVESIHAQHLSQGWTGIGYHFYVRKDGSIYRGRPVETVGAHCQGWNNQSVGICFEGDFEKEQMSAAQVKAGQAIVAYLKDLYPHAKVTRHKDLDSTACPGKNFRFDEMQKETPIMTVDEATEIVQTTAGLEDKTIEFLLCYKYGEDLIVKLAQAIKRK
jgi:N-acetylmuramoyl-L-alanine amidase CwlA